MRALPSLESCAGPTSLSSEARDSQSGSNEQDTSRTATGFMTATTCSFLLRSVYSTLRAENVLRPFLAAFTALFAAVFVVEFGAVRLEMGSSFAIGMCVVLYLLQCVLLYNAVCGLLGQVVALHNSGAPTTMMNGPPSSSASIIQQRRRGRNINFNMHVSTSCQSRLIRMSLLLATVALGCIASAGEKVVVWVCVLLAALLYEAESVTRRCSWSQPRGANAKPLQPGKGGHDANAADAAAKNIINFGEIREGGGPKAYLHNQLHRQERAAQLLENTINDSSNSKRPDGQIALLHEVVPRPLVFTPQVVSFSAATTPAMSVRSLTRVRLPSIDFPTTTTAGATTVPVADAPQEAEDDHELEVVNAFIARISPAPTPAASVSAFSSKEAADDSLFSTQKASRPSAPAPPDESQTLGFAAPPSTRALEAHLVVLVDVAWPGGISEAADQPEKELQRLREQQGELQTFGQPGELPLRAPAPQEFADAEDNLNQSLHDLAIPTAEEAEHWPVVSAPERDREGLAGVLVADRIGSLRDVLRQQNAAMKLGGQARDRSVDLDDLRKDLDDSSIRIADPADVALAEGPPEPPMRLTTPATTSGETAQPHTIMFYPAEREGQGRERPSMPRYGSRIETARNQKSKPLAPAHETVGEDPDVDVVDVRFFSRKKEKLSSGGGRPSPTRSGILKENCTAPTLASSSTPIDLSVHGSFLSPEKTLPSSYHEQPRKTLLGVRKHRENAEKLEEQGGSSGGRINTDRDEVEEVEPPQTNGISRAPGGFEAVVSWPPPSSKQTSSGPTPTATASELPGTQAEWGCASFCTVAANTSNIASTFTSRKPASSTETVASHSKDSSAATSALWSVNVGTTREDVETENFCGMTSAAQSSCSIENAFLENLEGPDTFSSSGPQSAFNSKTSSSSNSSSSGGRQTRSTKKLRRPLTKAEQERGRKQKQDHNLKPRPQAHSDTDADVVPEVVLYAHKNPQLFVGHIRDGDRTYARRREAEPNAAVLHSEQETFPTEEGDFGIPPASSTGKKATPPFAADTMLETAKRTRAAVEVSSAGTSKTSTSKLASARASSRASTAAAPSGEVTRTPLLKRKNSFSFGEYLSEEEQLNKLTTTPTPVLGTSAVKIAPVPEHRSSASACLLRDKVEGIKSRLLLGGSGEPAPSSRPQQEREQCTKDDDLTSPCSSVDYININHEAEADDELGLGAGANNILKSFRRSIPLSRTAGTPPTTASWPADVHGGSSSSTTSGQGPDTETHTVNPFLSWRASVSSSRPIKRARREIDANREIYPTEVSTSRLAENDSRAVFSAAALRSPNAAWRGVVESEQQVQLQTEFHEQQLQLQQLGDQFPHGWFSRRMKTHAESLQMWQDQV
eukprot:CAMPEP_0178984582 /NCGR_PEP_ID=MMETSP0795-20121207/1688_1 /TAXON_ID=88552 /ORGANISM="Amoebophrya sp., Strain Ameob2" /LENGTH=1369 /DNA_ID=CAMNT_0020675467 /DNA_START=16 /DNA_END=4126 /DNA_ORIENTATION=-